MSYGGYGYGYQEDRPPVRINPRLVIAALIALFGVATYFFNSEVNPVTGERQHIGMSVDEEKKLGLQAAPQMAAEMGGAISPRSDPRAAMVQEVGRKLVDGTEASKSPYYGNFHFYLLNDRKTVNAFALPGGQIFITEALYDKLKDEAELAGVLGHEIGHVIHRHSAQQMAKGKLGQILAAAVGVGASDRGDGGRGAARAAQMANSMIQLSYGRGDETQSDEYGLRLMDEVGYDPRAMLDVMKVLKNASGGGAQPEWMSSHPLPETRIQQIEAELQKNYSGGSSGRIGRGQPLNTGDRWR